MPSHKCDEFMPHESYYNYKCVKNGDACELTSKICEDYKKDECFRSSTSKSDYRCIYDDAAQKCYNW